ncbi:hypothetical protein [Metasolibacillus fluoroglycofenilyticus]|nr:hypothetical protein [Metasolibacillus fluoroglycofenilyticus]
MIQPMFEHSLNKSIHLAICEGESFLLNRDKFQQNSREPSEKCANAPLFG